LFKFHGVICTQKPRNGRFSVYLWGVMKTAEFISQLDRVDRMGIWALPMANLRLMFPEHSKTFMKAIGRMLAQGLLVRISKGLYLNPRASCKPPDVLAALTSFLRPWDLNYLSLESALAEAGYISQMPSRMTMMTTGRKGVFETAYGVVEFVHTQRNEDEILKEIYFDSHREIFVATPEKAARDLRRVGRNIQLLQHQEE
jgi:hypothetical protein